MALRRRHGDAAKNGVGPVVEVPPPDELRLADVPAPPPVPSGPVPRRPDGKVDGPEAARELGRRGGLAAAASRARTKAFATAVRMEAGIEGFEPSRFYKPYSDEAEDALPALLRQLADESDGIVSPAVAAIARSAIQQAYASRWLFDLGSSRALGMAKDGDGRPSPNVSLLTAASRLAVDARQSHLAAFHLQALEAEARSRDPRPERDPFYVIDEKDEAP